MRYGRGIGRGVGLLGLLVLAAAAAGAADTKKDAKAPPEPGWSDEAELGYVRTSGNSSTSTLAFENTAKRTWGRASLSMHASALRVVDDRSSRKAIGSADDFDVISPEPKTTAEKSKLNLLFSRRFSAGLLWTVGSGWERNRIAGIEDRVHVSAGMGQVVVNSKTDRLRTDLSATYTDQTDVIPKADADNKYVGLRFAVEYRHTFAEGKSFGNVTRVDESLRNTSNWTVDMTNRLTVEVSKHLALKLSLQHLYDNAPSLVPLDLFSPENPDGPSIGRVVVPADKLDTVFSSAMVVDF